MLKYILFTIAGLAPCLAWGASLADCDAASYTVTVNNGGMVRTQTISPGSGVLRSLGPMVSFQLPGQPAMRATRPEEEFCIWSGKIAVQRLDTIGDSGEGLR
jgi:hypothetical protein